MITSPARRDREGATLWRLFRAIVTGDAKAASHILAVSPRLSLDSTPVGASRASPAPFYLEEIEHYIYAGDTALHVAAAAFRTDIAKLLLAKGADPAARNRRGVQPIHYGVVGRPGSAIWNPRAQAALVECLLRAGADPNAEDNDGVPPLHRAVRTRCTSAVAVLLANGADPRRKSRRGSTPLHLSVQNSGRGGSGAPESRKEQVKVIRLLMQHGARTSDTDDRGKSVAECVRSEWIREILAAGLPQR